MERTLIQGIKRLRVLTPYDYDNMDELVQDLSNALEESASRSRTRKGRTWKWWSKSSGFQQGAGCSSSVPKSSAVSEDSESSLDGRMRSRMDSFVNGIQSDSDDLLHVHRLTGWRQRNTHMVESDSVNENFLPTRPQRRKRKFKRMAVDTEPGKTDNPISSLPSTEKSRKIRSMRLLKNKSKITKFCETELENLCNALEKEPLTLCGKRKRSIRERSLETISRIEHLRDYYADEDLVNSQGMDCEDGNKAHGEGSSSSLSSSESDAGIITNDEGREADDEQSDFFHEPDAGCGIPGLMGWWDDEPSGGDIDEKLDARFEAILNGSFHNMSEASKKAYHAKVSRLSSRAGREIRSGRRRLGKSRPAFSVMSSSGEKLSNLFLPSKMESAAQFMLMEQTISRSCVGDIKRRRRTPPIGPVVQGLVGENAEPIPDSNIGSKMLRSMGWEPGTGLGSDGGGIQNPIMAYIRSKREGLGFGQSLLSSSLFSSPNTSVASTSGYNFERPQTPPPAPPPSPQPGDDSLDLAEFSSVLASRLSVKDVDKDSKDNQSSQS